MDRGGPHRRGIRLKGSREEEKGMYGNHNGENRSNRTAGIRTWRMIALAAVLLLALAAAGSASAAAPENHHDAFAEKFATEFGGIDVESAYNSSFEGFDSIDSLSEFMGCFTEDGQEAVFYELPNGGILAVWDEILVLEEMTDGYTIVLSTSPDEGMNAFTVNDALFALVGPDGAGKKVLVIDLDDDGNILDLCAGEVASVDQANRYVNVRKTDKPIDYIAGYYEGSGSSSRRAQPARRAVQKLLLAAPQKKMTRASIPRFPWGDPSKRISRAGST